MVPVSMGLHPNQDPTQSRLVWLTWRAGASESGVQTGSVQVNFRAAMGACNAGWRRLALACRPGWASWKGLTIIKARSPWRAVTANSSWPGLRASAGGAQVVLNTGTRPLFRRCLGWTSCRSWTTNGCWRCELPSRLVIIGGGYISLEMAQDLRRLEIEVAILNRAPPHGPRGRDIAAAVTGMLTAEGIEVNTGVRIGRVGKADNDAGVRVQLAGGRSVDGSHLLVATGRIPNTDRLGLETVGLEVSARGHLVTNDRLQTAVPGIWALGDINQRGAFTHTSYHDQDIVAENLAGGSTQRRRASAFMPCLPILRWPTSVFMRLTREKLVTEGRRISGGSRHEGRQSRWKEEGGNRGQIKLLIDEDSGHSPRSDHAWDPVGRDHSRRSVWDGQWRHLEVGPGCIARSPDGHRVPAHHH